MDHGKPSLARPGLESGRGCAAAEDTLAENGGPPDDHFIDRALAGDQAAFGGLVERYQDRLYNVLVRFTGSPEDARDITQDALVQALVKLDRFRRDSAFFTWLYRIALNRAVSVGRKRRERVSLDGLHEQGAPEPRSGGPRPEASALECERAELVHKALAELAEEHRQVLVLREFDGLDYQQIAEIVETAVGTVRSRLFRARSQLRDVLVGYGLED